MDKVLAVQRISVLDLVDPDEINKPVTHVLFDAETGKVRRGLCMCG